MAWSPLPLLPTEPSLAREARLVLGVHPAGAPAHVSRTYTFIQPPTLAETRFVASEAKAPSRPSALIDGTILKVRELFAWVPSVATSTMIVLGEHEDVAPTQVSRTNIFGPTAGFSFATIF